MVERVIESDLPGCVKSFEYVKNSHYLKLRDADGTETKLLEHGLIRYWCLKCQQVWFSETNTATCCPCCRGEKISQQWMKPQLSLIPEEATDFCLLQNQKTEK